MTRTYIRRPMSLIWQDARIDLDLYKGPNGVDAEGRFGDKTFDNLTELVNIMGWTNEIAQGFIKHLNEVLNFRI